MKKIVLSLLAVIVVLGLFAAAGYAGYRFGYVQGARTITNGNATRPQPQLRPFNNFGPRGMPTNRFGFERGFRRGGSSMGGFWLFPLLMALGRLAVFVAVLTLVVWFVYWLVSRSGWRLTRQPAEIRQPEVTRETAQESSSKTENE